MRLDPHWAGEREVLRERDDEAREARLQQAEDGDPRPTFSTDTGGDE